MLAGGSAGTRVAARGPCELADDSMAQYELKGVSGAPDEEGAPALVEDNRRPGCSVGGGGHLQQAKDAGQTGTVLQFVFL